MTIDFRCWYCNKRYTKPEAQIGTRFRCTCEHTLKVPRRSGGRCRVKTPLDWLVEVVVYGGGCALLGSGLGLMIASRVPYARGKGKLIVGLTLGGLVIGTIGGERAVNAVGRMIRDRENS
jgi:hypothetical protein